LFLGLDLLFFVVQPLVSAPVFTLYIDDDRLFSRILWLFSADHAL
jgi:hypothetical protein